MKSVLGFIYYRFVQKAKFVASIRRTGRKIEDVNGDHFVFRIGKERLWMKLGCIRTNFGH